MTLYRRKPRPVDAFMWQPDLETMDGHYPFPEWMPEHKVSSGMLQIYCPDRTYYVLPNEWVLKEGERIWVCPTGFFEEEYEIGR